MRRGCTRFWHWKSDGRSQGEYIQNPQYWLRLSICSRPSKIDCFLEHSDLNHRVWDATQRQPSFRQTVSRWGGQIFHVVHAVVREMIIFPTVGWHCSMASLTLRCSLTCNDIHMDVAVVIILLWRNSKWMEQLMSSLSKGIRFEILQEKLLFVHHIIWNRVNWMA
jgi:hypothetical protein